MSIEAAITEEGGSAPAGSPVRIRRALLSVSDKTGVVEFARGLRELEVEILSTGGTAAAIRDAGLEVTDVAEFTGSEEILDGRVKTLHPRLYAALLARRDDPDHVATLEAEGIEPIDLVCVNLYPFEETIARPGVSEEEAIENIDIGGPTMIRAAAKNHRDVAVLVKPESYDAVLAELGESGGEISAETRHWLANEAFAHTAIYDAAISRWFGFRYEAYPDYFVMPHQKFIELAYGENPHQKAALYTETGNSTHVLSGIAKQHGKALSFNNVLDLDSARRLLDEFDEPACVIVKHNNPSGTAIAATAIEAYEKAFACDPLSAFGGVIVFNRPIDAALAERLARAVHRGPLRSRLRGRRAGAADPQGGGPDPRARARRVARLHAPRARREAGSRRAAGPGPRPRRRGPRVDDRADGGAAERGAVARPALRLEGLPARALERDRLRQGRGDDRDRRRADEPGGLGADRDRQGPRRARRRGRRAALGLGGRLGRLLPVPRRSGGRDPGRRHGADPARGVEARRRRGRRLRRGGSGDGLHRPPPLPTLETSQALLRFVSAPGSMLGSSRKAGRPTCRLEERMDRCQEQRHSIGSWSRRSAR